ncbi:hypothetical protein [Phytohabitans rumicis]|uniref:Uncharacterized protein n=1 Tax=Phytohabitans rumicis TaxID=1076125 RepID=A0A6V8KZ37_9ACTN|nr:hypothetical protein [Phytohabitans rumicis]GFJ87579.1 hypothetical protein Prum_012210 [Phytohabitans rumicis]
MSPDRTGEHIRSAFAQLTREQRDLSDLDRAAMAAFERLMQGRPELTDGAITVTNICTEAGISRASYYRSPAAPVIKSILAAPETTRPEPDELREEVTRLRQTERALRREHAAQLRELKDTITTYANQIQLLTLANAELREENNQLQRQAAKHTNLRVLDQDVPRTGGSESGGALRVSGLPHE